MNCKLGIKEWMERENPEPYDYPNREVNREIREKLIQEMIDSKDIIVPEDALVSVNAFLKEEIRVAQKNKKYRKGFTIVEAMVEGKKKIVAFASMSLAIQIMRYIKDTYKGDLSYELIQM